MLRLPVRRCWQITGTSSRCRKRKTRKLARRSLLSTHSEKRFRLDFWCTFATCLLLNSKHIKNRIKHWFHQRYQNHFQRLKNKIALSESEDKAAKEKLKEVLPELGKLRTRQLPVKNLGKKFWFVRTLEINRLLEEVKRDKAKLEGQCKDLNSDLKNKVRWDCSKLKPTWGEDL